MIETARQVAIAILLLGGIFFTFVAAVGVLRLPDVYARAHTASQADTLGAGFAMAAVALALYPGHRTVFAVLLLGFIFITNPTAAHAIARAAYEAGVPPWGRGQEPEGSE
ncbi:MAG: monovalent cation/H(+) antiporter subunit G [Halobacteriales archaeon]